MTRCTAWNLAALARPALGSTVEQTRATVERNREQ